MQGKTAAEVAQMTTSLYQQNLALQQQPSPSSPQIAPPPSQAAAPDPNLIYSDPAAYQAQYDAYVRGITQTAVQSQMQQYAPVVSQAAETARELSKLGSLSDVWRRWEPEVEMQMQGIPSHLRTKALYDQAAQIVKANHLDELASERAQQLLAQGDTGTVRGSGSGSLPPAPAGDALDKAWDESHPYFDGMKREGLTKADVRRFCTQMGQSVDDYVKSATLGQIIPSKHGFTRAAGSN